MCLHLYENKNNYEYDSAKYDMKGMNYIDTETLSEYINEFYPSLWESIQSNLKKEEFFYNKIISNCNFFNKEEYPALIVKNEEVIKEVIEKNSWLKKKLH